MLQKHHIISASSYLLCKLMLNNLSERKKCFVRPVRLQPGVIEPTNLVYCWKWTTHDVNGLHGAPLNDFCCKSTRRCAPAVLAEREKLTVFPVEETTIMAKELMCFYCTTINMQHSSAKPISCRTSPQYYMRTIQQ